VREEKTSERGAIPKGFSGKKGFSAAARKQIQMKEDQPKRERKTRKKGHCCGRRDRDRKPDEASVRSRGTGGSCRGNKRGLKSSVGRRVRKKKLISPYERESLSEGWGKV